MVETLQRIRREILDVMLYRRSCGSPYPYWFALVEDSEYPEPDDPAIRLVTLTESMPLTTTMSADMANGPLHFFLYGRYLVVDVLDDRLPPVMDPPGEDMVRAIEVVVALHPGPGMTTSAAVSSISLGLPGGWMSSRFVLASTQRPQGWPP